jgi:hypothetical protein
MDSIDKDDPKSIARNFHRNVKTALIIRGKRLSDLANHLDMSRQGLNFHLNQSNPNLEIVKKIALYLNTEPFKLLYTELKQDDKSLKSEYHLITNSFAKQNECLEMLIKYYVLKYPEDPISNFIQHRVGFLGFSKSSITIDSIKKIVNENLPGDSIIT